MGFVAVSISIQVSAALRGRRVEMPHLSACTCATPKIANISAHYLSGTVIIYRLRVSKAQICYCSLVCRPLPSAHHHHRPPPLPLPHISTFQRPDTVTARMGFRPLPTMLLDQNYHIHACRPCLEMSMAHGFDLPGKLHPFSFHMNKKVGMMCRNFYFFFS